MVSKFVFVGDLCLAGSNNRTNHSFLKNCRQWQQLTQKADLTVANLESCLLDDSTECGRFMATTKSAYGVIAESGINIFTLANNHILDCGEESLNFCRNFLRKLNISTVGAGSNLTEANAALIVNSNDTKIGIIATTDATHYKATSQRAGIAPLSFSGMKKAIKKIRNDVDLIILCIHSDLEFTNYPSPWKVRLSRRLAKAGADIIIHHHPHTLQGIEIYDDTLIAYSLGNFMFPVHGQEYMENRAGNVNEAAILEVDVSRTRESRNISYKILPTVIEKDNNTRFANKTESDEIISRINAYSSKLSQPGELRKAYFRLCLKQANRFVWGTYYTLSKSGIEGAYKYIHTHFSTRMHRNWMRGMLTMGWL